MNNKALKTLGHLDILIAEVSLTVLIILTFFGVFMRYVLRSPIVWMEELQMLLFVWAVFMSAGAAFRNGSHIAIEIVVDSLPRKIRSAVESVDVLIELLILVYLFIQSWSYYFQLVGANKVSILLQIPYGVAYLAVPVGCFLMIVSLLFAEVSKRLPKKAEGGEV